MDVSKVTRVSLFFLLGCIARFRRLMKGRLSIVRGCDS